MRRINPTFSTILVKKNAGVKARYNHRPTKLAIAMNSALICFGVATITLTGAAIAKSNNVPNTSLQVYKIPPGSLKGALDGFAKQKRINLSF